MKWIRSSAQLVARAIATSRKRASTAGVLDSAAMDRECDETIALLRSVPRGLELSGLLNALADQVGTAAGAERVLLRLYNPRTRLFEARAHSGLDLATVRALSNHDVSDESYREVCVAAGGAMILPRESEFADMSICSGHSPGVLLVTLGTSADKSEQGYLVVEIPAGKSSSWMRSRLKLLRTFAPLATLAIDAARVRGQVEQKSVDLSIAAEKLKDLQRLKDNFVGAVSHELRTPLTSIKAYAETLHRGAGRLDDRTLHEFTQVILGESERLNTALENILDVAQLESGRARLLPQEVDLAAVCRAAYERARDALREARVSLSLQLPDRGVHLRADRGALDQILDHLLGNARKFTPPGGYVRIRVREDVSMVRLEVEDSGIGIPESELERIFERFHQVDNSSTRNFGGQGLGLSICRDLVRWHGGRIWAERAAEGGARFVVLLPSKGLIVQPHSVSSLQPGERMERDQFLHLLISFVAETMDVSIASLMLIDSKTERLYLEAAVGLEDEIVRSVRLAKGEGIAGHVWETKHTLLVENLDTDDRFKGRLNDVQYTTRSLLSCPILRDGECIGVVNVNNKSGERRFLYQDRLLLEALVERIGRAIEVFAAYAASHRQLARVNESLSAALDSARSRDSLVCTLLFECGMETAKGLELGEAELRALAFALRCYDLGLARVDEQILHKSGPLTAEERRRVEEHVRVGAELVESLAVPPSVLKMLVHHHENIDGTGYPEGLRGEAIPVGARIVRLVDFSSGLLRPRPERPARQLDALEQCIESATGTALCPRVTPVFLAVVRSRRERLQAAITAQSGPLGPGMEVSVALASEPEGQP